MTADILDRNRKKGLNDVKHKYGHPRFDCISNENIKAAVDLADTYLSDNGIESAKRTRCRLALEEMLLQYQERDGNAPFELILARSITKVVVKLRVKGERFNILEANEHLIVRAREIGITTLPV